MTLEIIVVVLALAFLQIWGANNPLHSDQWFYRWSHYVRDWSFGNAEWRTFLSVALPLLLVLIINEVLASQSIWITLPFVVLVLLYSFGRGEFFAFVRSYTQACYVEDWDSATQRALQFQVNLDDVERDDWASLHQHVLDEAAYRGFERLFAVLFWFLVLGPVGALMYRLVFLLLKQQTDSQQTGTAGQALLERWQFLLDWPAVRVLGITFAMTGNFSSSFEQWKVCFFCRVRSAREVLRLTIIGALSANDVLPHSCEITRKELSMMVKLYQRSLWFWVAGVSFIALFI